MVQPKPPVAPGSNIEPELDDDSKRPAASKKRKADDLSESSIDRLAAKGQGSPPEPLVAEQRLDRKSVKADALRESKSPDGPRPRLPTLPPDAQRLDRFRREYPKLSAGGISFLRGDQGLPAGLSVTDVDMDKGVAVVDAAGGKALGTKGLATCFAVCSRGVAESGRTFLALGHFSGVAGQVDAREIVEQVLGAMTEAGVRRPYLFVVGGQTSLFVPILDGAVDHTSSLDPGIELVKACGDRLVAARIGITQTESSPQVAEHGFVKHMGVMLPESVDLVISASGVYCKSGPVDHDAPADAAAMRENGPPLY